MAIQMTREEYNAKYGVAPVFTAPSEIDNEPVFSTAPVKMTQAEYDAKYGDTTTQTADQKSADIFKPLFPSKQDDTIVESGLKAAGNIIPSAFNLGKGLVEMALSPIETTKNVLSIVKGGGEKIGRETLERTGFEEQAGEVAESENEQAFNQVMGFMKDNYWGTENLERTVVNDPFGFGIDMLGVLTGGASIAGKVSKVDKATTLGKVDKAISKTAQTVTKPSAEVINKAKQYIVKTPDQLVTKRANEIFDIESGYAKNRRINDQAKDSGNASRQRIATTDVLANSVDEKGMIRTKQKGGAIDQYKKQTIDGVEGIVRQNLEREGAVVNVEEVSNYLKRIVNGDGTKGSGLEGSDLISSIRKIDREIDGLRLRADEFGNVPLAKIQDAKISTTSNIDYTKPVGVTYRKLLARGYKELIEKKSKTNVGEINGELAKYYDDIKRLENLDGRRVEGGRLGKHFAQISGNIAGATLGSVGGPLGSLAGTVIGGEVSSALKGRSMKKTFGKDLDIENKPNLILDEAKATAALPPVRDLKTPDLKVRLSSSVPKTEEVVRLERQIDNNIKQQKKAIATKDFTLVKVLKEIYTSLVDGLVEVVNRLKADPKNIPNKEGGFIKVGKEKVKPQSKVNESVSLTNNTTKELAEQAKKFDSADKFVKSQGKTLYHTTGKDFDKFDSRFKGSNTGDIATNTQQGFFFTDDLKNIDDFKNTLERGIKGFRDDKITKQDTSKYRIIEKVARDEDFLQLNPSKVDELSAKDAEFIMETLGTEDGRILKGQEAIEEVEFIFDDLQMQGAEEMNEVFNEIAKQAKKKGYTGLKTDFGNGVEEYVVFDPNKLQTKSQLEDIWKQANK